MAAQRTAGVRIVFFGAMISLVLLLASFVWAAMEKSLGAGLSDVASTRWGIVTLGDLGFGLVLVALWIAAHERRSIRVALWCLGLALLGNFTALVYLMIRARRSLTVREMMLGERPG